MSKKVKEIILDLKLEDLKNGQVYRSKKPKMIGVFGPLVDDRQIVYVSPHRSIVDRIDHGYTPEFEEWCKKHFYHTMSSENTQITFEGETGKNAKNIEAVWDYTVQYDSPTVGPGKKYPITTASKFLKWAEKNVTEIMPKGAWASTL